MHLQRKQQALAGAPHQEFLGPAANPVGNGTPAFMPGTSVTNPVVEAGEPQFAAALQPLAEESVKTE